MAKAKATKGNVIKHEMWVAWLGESKLSPETFPTLEDCQKAYPGAPDYFKIEREEVVEEE